jgi:hypothetical protein
MTEFDPYLIFDALNRHSVEFIVIGGLAGNLLGSDINTNDLDVCYRRTPANLKGLVSALKEVGATLRGAPADLPFLLDERTLRNGDSFTFDTSGGPFDCLGTPAGTSGYDDLLRSSKILDIGNGREVRVCSLDDLIRMKKTAGRAKDRWGVEQLNALKKLIDSGGGSS